MGCLSLQTLSPVSEKEKVLSSSGGNLGSLGEDVAALRRAESVARQRAGVEVHAAPPRLYGFLASRAQAQVPSAGAPKARLRFLMPEVFNARHKLYCKVKV